MAEVAPTLDPTQESDDDSGEIFQSMSTDYQSLSGGSSTTTQQGPYTPSSPDNQQASTSGCPYPEVAVIGRGAHFDIESDRYMDIGDEDVDSDATTVISQNSVDGRGASQQHSGRHYDAGLRRRGSGFDSAESSGQLDASYQEARNMQYEIVQKPENKIEAQKMANNYLFGFRKWKSHVTSRPLSERSDKVKALYLEADLKPSDKADASTISVGNIFYCVFFGWLLALLYVIVGCLMFLTIVGHKYGFFCFKLAAYVFWPFGKFVHKNIPPVLSTSSTGSLESLVNLPGSSQSSSESTPLVASNATSAASYSQSSELSREQQVMKDRMFNHRATGYWRRFSTYLWLLLGVPILVIAHGVVFLLAWLSVVCVPIAKVNAKIIRRILFLPPELFRVDQSNFCSGQPSSDIILYIHSAANLYYYKYTVDGINIICFNLLALVPLAIGLGYGDRESTFMDQQWKFLIALSAVIPLAYCIGMGITSLSAQTSSAIGAVLNATFGSTVEIILYMTALVKGENLGTTCYSDLVKSGLAGTLLATTMLIPGLAMVIGGLKHSTLRFNARSAGVGATLLFVSVAGVFAPSIFARSFSQLKCTPCVNSSVIENASTMDQCMDCEYNDPSPEFYKSSILPLVYICMLLLPVAYIVGLVFSLKTHRGHIYDTFAAEVGDAGAGHHAAVLWGKWKSLAVLVVAITLMSVCADLVTENIQPILNESGISVYFIGVTLLAIVPDIPEIVVGIQFALQNNMSLSIEVGSCIAVQVCMLQVPVLVLANLIYPMGFTLIFTDVIIWSVLLGVLMMNYIYQDGKSDYFQGSAMVLAYLILIAMYFFIPNPADMVC